MTYKCKLFEAVNTSMTLVFSIDTHLHTISKVIGIKKELKMCLQNKESLSGYRCERANMVAKCKNMNYSKNIIGICKKKNKYG